jgi:conjugal transfer pilus assembly protein TraI
MARVGGHKTPSAATNECRYPNLFRSRLSGGREQHVQMGLFGRRKTASTPAPGGASAASADDPEIPRYPPFLRGLPVAAPARIVATQAELIARLQDGLAFTDARFTVLVRPVVERYAAFVHLLPASESHHHRGAGGLFRHGLEVAFHAAQASQGRIFALDRSPAERRELEPRWRLAAGLAGLCHDVGKPVSDLSVSDRAGRTTWRPLLGSLTDWAAANGVAHYFIRWRERRHARHETFGLLVLERVLTPEVMAWLVDADPEILQGLLSAVAGMDDGAVLGRLVTEADRASVERDLRENHIDPAATALGVPVDRYLLDAMRRLARGGRWQINVPGARLWMLAEGLHLVWPAGAEDVVGLLAADKVPGIPRDPDTLADILLERGLALPRQEGAHTHRYWRLAPAPLARDGQVVTLSMLRLASPDLVLAGAPPAPVGVVLPLEPSMRGGAGPSMEMAVTETLAASGESVGEGTFRRMPASAGPEPAFAQGAGQQGAPVADALAPADPQSAPRSPVHLADVLAGEGTDLDGQLREPESTATTWLRARGAGGEALLALADVLSADPATWDQRIRRKGERLVVLFPDGLSGLGTTPQAALDALAQSSLLDLNPLAPLRRVIEIEGRHGAPLTLEASHQLLALVPSDGSGPPKPVAAAPAAKQATATRARHDREPASPTKAPSDRRDTSPADPDPARALVERIRARDQTLPVVCPRPIAGSTSPPRPSVPGRRRRECRSMC